MKYLITIALLISSFYGNGQSTLPRDHYVVRLYDNNAFTTLAKNSIPAFIDDSDFPIIDSVLDVCIDRFNQEQAIEYKRMIKEFTEHGLQLKDLIIDLKRYYRQYVAVKNAKGEKEVWVNCLCTIESWNNWRNKILTIMDGGICFFNVRINLTMKTYIDLKVNGDKGYSWRYN